MLRSIGGIIRGPFFLVKDIRPNFCRTLDRSAWCLTGAIIGIEHVSASNRGQENPCDPKRTADDMPVSPLVSARWLEIRPAPKNIHNVPLVRCAGSAPQPSPQLTGDAFISQTFDWDGMRVR